jgi:hypothetical protein
MSDPKRDSLLKQIKQQNEQIAETKKSASAAQNQALTQAQDNAAKQRVLQANLAAQQSLGIQQDYQQALDAAAQSASKFFSGFGAVPQIGTVTAPSMLPQSQMISYPKLESGDSTDESSMSPQSVNTTSSFMSRPAGKKPGAFPGGKSSAFALPDTAGLKFGGS